MPSEEPKSCLTHAELAAEFRAFKELTRVMFEERKSFIDERFNGVDRAIAGIKEATSLAFAGSEKAIVKSETSQREYNVGHNDLSRKMENQYKDMLPRQEAERMITAMSEKFEDLKKEIIEFRSHSEQDRGTYAQKTDLVSAVEKLEVALKPLLAFSINQQGRTAGVSSAWGVMIAVVGMIGGGGLVGIMLILLRK